MSYPVPFKDYIPKMYREDTTNPDLVDAFCNKVDDILQKIKDDTVNLRRLHDAEKCPAEFLDDLALIYGVVLQPSMSETTKRKTIAGAVTGQKLRTTFTFDVKPKIDSVAGGNSVVFGAKGSDDWIIVTRGEQFAPSAYYWSAIGGVNSSDPFGIRIVSGRTDVPNQVLKGQILIDVDNSTLTANDVENIILLIQDSCPAYYIIWLGYESSGSFVAYANGRIG